MFNESQYPVHVRADIPEAFRSAWAIIAAPGNWWSAEERLAIAQEARNANDCTVCRERNAALSPNADAHKHPASNILNASAIDAVHRITTDASRLSKPWLDSLAGEGLSDAHYIELLGIVVALISIDTFHLALGTAVEKLPEPMPGKPTGYRPPGATEQGAWVATVTPEDLTANEADMYAGASQAGNVQCAMSLVPSSVALLMVLSNAQYLKPTDVPNPSANGGRALDRSQIELLAGRVSSINECFY